MATRCEICGQEGLGPNIVYCRRTGTPLVQGRWQGRTDRPQEVLVGEKMEECRTLIFYMGAGEAVTIDGVIRVKPRILEEGAAEAVLACSR